MPAATLTRQPDAAELAALDVQQMMQLLRSQSAQIEALRAQIEWFKRQLFGQKSERYAPQPDAAADASWRVDAGSGGGARGRAGGARAQAAQPRSDFADDRAGVPFFDEARVPVVSIEVPNPEVQGLTSEQYEVVARRSATVLRSARAPTWC